MGLNQAMAAARGELQRDSRGKGGGGESTLTLLSRRYFARNECDAACKMIGVMKQSAEHIRILW